MLWLPDFNHNLLKLAGISVAMIPAIISTLHDYWKNYRECFSNFIQFKHFSTYFKGLMSELDRKSVEPIALEFGGPALVRPLQFFLTRSTWSLRKMRIIYQGMVSRFISDADGMFTVDGCDCQKQGDKTVGVARQYCGRPREGNQARRLPDARLRRVEMVLPGQFQTVPAKEVVHGGVRDAAQELRHPRARQVSDENRDGN
jgi:hypothetical protein